jgi:hypothetical protein
MPIKVSSHPFGHNDLVNPILDFGDGLDPATVLTKARIQIALGPIDLAALKVAPSPSLLINCHKFTLALHQ